MRCSRASAAIASSSEASMVAATMRPPSVFTAVPTAASAFSMSMSATVM